MAGKAKEKRVRHPRQIHRRWWTDEERFAILAAVDANGGNIAKTSAETGCPYNTIYGWINGTRCFESSQLRSEKKGKLADAYEDVAWMTLSLIPQTIHDASFSQLITGAAIATDKMRLLRDEPTAINQNQQDAALNTRLVELLKKLSHDERSQLEAVLARHAAGGSDDGQYAAGTAIDQGSGPTGELSPVPESGVPDRGSLGNIQG